MITFQKIREDQLRFRKLAANGSVTAKVYAKLLTTLMGEAAVDGKDPDSDQLTKTIQKFVKTTKQSIAIRETEESLMELQLLESFLPKSVTADQVIEIKESHPDLNKGQLIGLVKSFCKENNVLFDGKLVSSLI